MPNQDSSSGMGVVSQQGPTVRESLQIIDPDWEKQLESIVKQMEHLNFTSKQKSIGIEYKEFKLKILDFVEKKKTLDDLLEQQKQLKLDYIEMSNTFFGEEGSDVLNDLKVLHETNANIVSQINEQKIFLNKIKNNLNNITNSVESGVTELVCKIRECLKGATS